MTELLLDEAIINAIHLVYTWEDAKIQEQKKDSNERRIEMWVFDNKINFYKNMVETLRQAEKL